MPRATGSRPQDNRGPDTGQEPARPQRGHNNSSACDWCRDKRKKCDGSPPSASDPPKTCTNCEKFGLDCNWTAIPDGRRVGQMLKHLKSQVAALQQRLRDHGLPDTVDDLYEDSIAPGGGPSKDEIEFDTLSQSFGNLVLDQESLTFYGTSAPFSNLPRAEESPLNVKRPTRPRNSLEDTMSHKLCLTVEDAQAVDQMTSSNWLLFLPGETASLVSRKEHDTVLLRFFQFFSSWNIRIIPRLFLRDLAIATNITNAGSGPRTNHYSAVLHNAILAVALQLSDNVYLRSRYVRDRFAKYAKMFIERECQSPSLPTVQTLALLSTYHCGLSEQSLGFMYFGMSARMCQARKIIYELTSILFGLHVPVSNPLMSEEELAERNNVFWSTFVQDKSWSFYVGRDQGVPPPHRSVPDPIIFEELDNEPWVWPPTGDGVANVTYQRSYLSTTFAEMVKLMRLASQIMEAVYGMNGTARPVIDMNVVSRIHKELRTWEDQLRRSCPGIYIADPTGPTTASRPPHAFVLHFVYDWLLLLLLKPLYQPETSSAPETELRASNVLAVNGTGARPSRREVALAKLRKIALDECPKSADRIVALLGTYHSLFTLRMAPIPVVQVAFVAGQTHLQAHLAKLSVRNERQLRSTGGPAHETSTPERMALVQCIGYLKELGDSWSSGKVTGELLESALAKEEAVCLMGSYKEQHPYVTQMDAAYQNENQAYMDLHVPNHGVPGINPVSDAPSQQLPGFAASSYLGLVPGNNIPSTAFAPSPEPAQSNSFSLMPHGGYNVPPYSSASWGSTLNPIPNPVPGMNARYPNPDDVRLISSQHSSFVNLRPDHSSIAVGPIPIPEGSDQRQSSILYNPAIIPTYVNDTLDYPHNTYLDQGASQHTTPESYESQTSEHRSSPVGPFLSPTVPGRAASGVGFSLEAEDISREVSASPASGFSEWQWTGDYRHPNT